MEIEQEVLYKLCKENYEKGQREGIILALEQVINLLNAYKHSFAKLTNHEITE
jgi:predicted nucleic acid-binding protein